MSLLKDGEINGIKQHRAKMAVESAPFSDTFGPKAQRKRVKLDVGSLEDLAGETVKMHDTYLERMDQVKLLSGNSGAGEDAEDEGSYATAREPVFSKGQSKRIWNELYKVIDSSDVVIHVIDARNPEGTRCRGVEKYIREEAPHKHLVFVLNKCDLVPTKVAVRYIPGSFSFTPLFAFYILNPAKVPVPLLSQVFFLCNLLPFPPWKFLSVTALVDRCLPAALSHSESWVDKLLF
jgi:nuclear GTP-binding protein